MPNSCVSCSKTTSDPYNFLLKCVQCALFWHHRCHKPPVPDTQLIEIIKLFNAEKLKGNPNAKRVWTCGACVKGKAKATEPEVNTIASKATPSTRLHAAKFAASRPQQVTSSKSSRPAQNDTIVIDDDDDVVVILEQPAAQPAAVNRQAKHAAVAKSSKARPIVLPHAEPEQQSALPSRLSATSERVPEERRQVAAQVHSKSPSNDNIPVAARLQVQQGSQNPASIPPMTPISSHKAFQQQLMVQKKTTIAKRYDTGLRVVDDPFVVPANLVPTPAPAPAVARPPVVQKRSSSSSSSALVSGFIDLTMSTDEDSVMGDHDRHKLGGNSYEEEDEDALEYLTPPQPPAVLLPPETPRAGVHDEQTLLPADTALELSTTKPLLLPAWIDAQRTAADAEPDLWERAARRGRLLRPSNANQISTANQPSSSGTGVEPLPNAVHIPSRRKKFMPQRLNTSGEKEEKKTISQTPFFFDADVWMKQKMATLTLCPQ